MNAPALAKAVSNAEASLDALYPWLFGSTLIVVIGLATEYWPNVRRLLSERLINRILLIEMIGGILVTIGVSGELIVQFFQHSAETTLRITNDRYAAYLNGKVDRLGKSLATMGVEVTQEKERTASSVPSPPVTASRYKLSDEAMQIIQKTTRPGAIVSIIPFMQSLESFADQLGAAFAGVPGVQVAVGHGNMIMNGQTGLIVQFDHENPASRSVFEALQKAGLDPVAGPPTPGTPIVFIKVAPP